MVRLIGLGFGILMTSLGLFFLIIYFNLIEMGYNLVQLVKFILMRLECYLFPLGLILIKFNLGRK